VGEAIARLSVGPTLSGQAYVVLRRLITEGELAPGERVTERGLATQLGVSPTPVREAIRRLEHERLLERLDGRALTVARPSFRRLYELNQIEAALRGVAAGLAAEAATDRELRAIRRIQEQASELKPAAGSKSDALAVLALTRKMHRQIDEASHHALLVDMIASASAFDLSVRMRVIEQLGRDYPSEHGHREHLAIVEALESRDSARADALVREHVLGAGRRFLDVLVGGQELDDQLPAVGA
jgi:DNA-binding GntR family transcriptional regulator